MKKNITLLFTILILSTPQLIFAQSSSSTKKLTDRWYVGGGAAFSFGSSTFQSIGADKTRLGWGLGVLGGYRINSFLSTEASFDYTHLGLESYNCCQSLWLDEMRNRLINPTSGKGVYSYKNIYSSVNLYQLGLHLNVDFLRMFRSYSRWSVMLSPAIYGVGSSAKVKVKDDKSLVYNGNGNIHFGVGGDLGVGYQATKNINIRLYSGINYLTGAPIDALPRVEHKSNYVWNTGVKVIFSLGKKAKTKRIKTPIAAAPTQSYTEEIKSTPIVERATPVEVEKSTPTKTTVVTETVVTETVVTETMDAPIVAEKTIYQTTIYFDTNSANVKKQFYLGIAKFINKAKENSNANVIIDGWADPTGTDNINSKISNMRAEVLRNYFISQGINSERISYRGNGVDTNTSTNPKARRTDVLLTISE